MATVRAIITDALLEIGALGPGETLDASLAAVGLLRFQNQLDAWQADRLDLAVLARAYFTLTSGTSTVTIGTGGSVTTTPATTTAPMFLDHVTYVNPASSPEVEVPIGQMSRDDYEAITIKALPSALPTQCFYQRSNTTALGSLFFWPQVTQNVTIYLYSLQGTAVPASLSDTIIGPAGYADAFMYDLAVRLCPATGTTMPDGLPALRSLAMRRMQRPNVSPGTLGVDPAVTNQGGAGYNILSDTMQTAR
jgi:hypothetical protein